jgi:hypothetical protein
MDVIINVQCSRLTEPYYFYENFYNLSFLFIYKYNGS